MEIRICKHFVSLLKRHFSFSSVQNILRRVHSKDIIIVRQDIAYAGLVMDRFCFATKQELTRLLFRGRFRGGWRGGVGGGG